MHYSHINSDKKYITGSRGEIVQSNSSYLSKLQRQIPFSGTIQTARRIPADLMCILCFPSGADLIIGFFDQMNHITTAISDEAVCCTSQIERCRTDCSNQTAAPCISVVINSSAFGVRPSGSYCNTSGEFQTDQLRRGAVRARIRQRVFLWDRFRDSQRTPTLNVNI